MTIPVVVNWLLVVAFAGAGIVNALGIAGTRENFVHWGYPRWWRQLTAVLEIAIAALIASSATRTAGLLLGTAVIAAAIITVLRHRDYTHLSPLGLYVALLAVAWTAG